MLFKVPTHHNNEEKRETDDLIASNSRTEKQIHRNGPLRTIDTTNIETKSNPMPPSPSQSMSYSPTETLETPITHTYPKKVTTRNHRFFSIPFSQHH